MAIPVFALQAAGGKVFWIDDPAVATDSAALDGTGGTGFTPFIVTQPFSLRADLGYSKFRRFLQRLAHASVCTVKVGVLRDGLESGVVIVRPLALGDVGIVNIPLNEAGSDFQLKISLSAYTAETALGNSQVFIVPKRRSR